MLCIAVCSFAWLKLDMGFSSSFPHNLNFQSVMNLRADGVGMLCGRLHVGTSEKIPPSELVDTTGAGDAFTGAVLYGTMKKQLAFSCIL